MKSPSISAIRRSAGFTLIELLTVIAIIGILAAIIIPTVGSVREKAKQAQCVSNLRSWGTAINTYAVENRGNYWITRDDGYEPWCVAGEDSNNRYYPYFKATRSLETFIKCPSISDYSVYGVNTPQYTAYVMIRPTYKGVASSYGAAPISKATTPARTLLMIERQMTDTAAAATGVGASYSINEAGTMRNAYRVYKRHNKGINAVMMDSHVKRMYWDNGDAGTSLVGNPNGSGTGDIDPLWFTLDK